MDEPSLTPQPQKTSVGALVGIAIVVILFAAGGIYFFYQQKEKLQSLQAQQQAGLYEASVL